MKKPAAESPADSPENGDQAEAKPRKSKTLLLAAVSLPLLLAGIGAAVYVFVPGVAKTVQAMLPGHATPAPAQASNKPTFIDLPEMAVTLPNGGHARQLRIRISLELAKNAPAPPSADLLSPRLYDALLTYLRTLRDNEVEGGLAMDRMRADLFRRTELMLGTGTVRDVLITSLVIG